MSKLFTSTTTQRQSLEAFKANAAAVPAREAIEKITGGLLADCHKPC